MSIQKYHFFILKDYQMADTIQVHLPPEMNPVFEDIREIRAKEFKPTSNKSIVIDAVKDLHKKVTK